MKLRRTLPVTAAVLMALSLPAPVRALPGASAFQAGMPMREALRVFGPARDKMSYETKREERWIYEGFSVVFREGLLRSWSVKSGGRPPAAHELRETEAALSQDGRPLPQSAFSELWRELQSASTGDTPGDKKPPGMPPRYMPPVSQPH